MRRGGLGLGPNLSRGLIDLTVEGIGVQLRAPLQVGDEAEIILVPSWGGKLVKAMARVCWCRSDGECGFLAGVQLNRRLSYRDLSELVR